LFGGEKATKNNNRESKKKKKRKPLRIKKYNYKGDREK